TSKPQPPGTLRPSPFRGRPGGGESPAPTSPHPRSNTPLPENRARLPSPLTITIDQMYFPPRSERVSAPVSVCPAAAPTARSAIGVSAVSPDRCDTTVV